MKRNIPVCVVGGGKGGGGGSVVGGGKGGRGGSVVGGGKGGEGREHMCTCEVLVSGHLIRDWTMAWMD